MNRPTATLSPTVPIYTLPPVAPPVWKVGSHEPKYNETTLVEKAGEYFNFCKLNNEAPNVSDLCDFLDIDPKHTWLDYRKRYPRVASRIMNKIQGRWVQRLNGAYCTGAIFYLKNVFREDFKDYMNAEMLSERPMPILAALARTIRKTSNMHVDKKNEDKKK